MSAKKFTADPFPKGVRMDGCTVASSLASIPVTFVRSSDGTIYTLGRRSVCVLEPWQCNDRDRAVYAKLAGITVSAIDAARKALNDRRRKASEKSDLESLKNRALRKGYKLVKSTGVRP